jgi:hypothetical protein
MATSQTSELKTASLVAIITFIWKADQLKQREADVQVVRERIRRERRANRAVAVAAAVCSAVGRRWWWRWWWL